MCGLPNDGADEIVRNHYARSYADAWEVAERLRADLPELEATTRSFHAGAVLLAPCPPRWSTPSSPPWSCCAAPPASFWTTGQRTAGSPPGRAASTTPAAARGPAPTSGATPRRPPGCSRPWSAAPGEPSSCTRRCPTAGCASAPTPSSTTPRWTSIPPSTASWAASSGSTASGASAATTTSSRSVAGQPAGRWSSPSPPGTPTATACSTRQQHNTYDIEFYGENTLANSMFFAALPGRRAASPTHLGEPELAERWREAAEVGAQLAPTRCCSTASTTAAHRRRRRPSLSVRRRAACPTSCSARRYAHLNGPRSPAARRARPQRDRGDRSSTTSARTSATTTACSARTRSTTSRAWCCAPGRAAADPGSRSSTATRCGPASSTRSRPT